MKLTMGNEYNEKMFPHHHAWYLGGSWFIEAQNVGLYEFYITP